VNEWYFLVAPIAILAVLSLFRFVGCAQILGVEDWSTGTSPNEPPDYRKTILDEPSLVSYWRLQEKHNEEPSNPTVDNTPVLGGTAKDEHGVNNGTYKRVIVSNPPSDSPDAPGSLILESTGLLDLGGPNTSLFVDGGYVEVPFSNSLLLTSFTVEALVFPEWSKAETGLYRTVIAFTTSDFHFGFALYAGPEDPVALTGPPIWQVWLGDGTQFQQINFNHGSLPLVDFTKANYIAVTYDDLSNLLNLYTYVVGIDLDNGPFNPVLDLPVTYGLNTDPTTKLVIGVDRTVSPFYPFKGRIQEVAIYNQALTRGRVISHIGEGLNLA
jgi:hypothetical protein